jgi:ketosteroid isomerase-like protein
MSARAAAERLFDRRRLAWLADDLDAYLECWAEDMTFASPMHDPPLTGRAAYADLLRRSAAVVRPVAFDVRHLAVADDVVLAEWTIRVADRRTDRETSWDGMSRARYRDGRIVEWREYWNPADVRRITGG